MRTSVEPLEGNKVKLSVEVDEAEFDSAVDAVFRKMAREVKVPGFRPGKVPRRILEARMGREGVRREAMREALPEFYAKALREVDLDVIAPPEIDITGGEESGALAFDAVVEVRPQVKVTGYQGLRVEVPSPGVPEEEVDRQIDRLRQPFGELRPVQRAARDGDHVTIDLRAYRHDETIRETTDELYEVGSASIVPELDEQLRGAKAGDIFKFNTQLGDDGEEISFRVLVKDVKEMVLPDVTDEWASEASEFETVAELRDDLRRRMGIVRRMQASLAARDEVVKAVSELVVDDIPPSLVRGEVESRFEDLERSLAARGVTVEQYLESTQQSEEQLLEAVRSAALDAVKADLALRAVAEAENLEASEEDLDAEIARLAERVGEDAGVVRQRLERAEQMSAVRSDVRRTKALAWLMDHVEMVDEEGNRIDPADLTPTTPAGDEHHHDHAHDHDHESQPEAGEKMEPDA